MKEVNLYIETSIRGPRRCAGAYGYVLETYTAAGAVTLTNFKRMPETTESQSLALALEEALMRLKEGVRLNIYTQSAYIGCVLKSWIPEWSRNGWKNKRDKPVADADTWQKVAELLKANDFFVTVGAQHQYQDYLMRESESVAAGKPFNPL